MTKKLFFNLLYRGHRGIRRFYFPVFLVTAILIFSAQKAGIVLPKYLNNYANDFFCIPLVLGLSQFAIRSIRSDKTLRLPIPLIACITAYYSIYFEYYLPDVNTRYTGDPVDVAMYFLGMLLFCLAEYGAKRLRKIK